MISKTVLKGEKKCDRNKIRLCIAYFRHYYGIIKT